MVNSKIHHEMSDEESIHMQTPPSTGDNGLIHIKESQRNNLLKRVQKDVDDVLDYSKYSFHQLEVKLSLLERHFESFEKIQNQLETLDESQLGTNYRFEFEDAYVKLKSQLLELLSIQRSNINEPGMTSTQYGTTFVQQPMTPHLPTLQLTKFNGNQNDWTEFYNMFCVLVHDNPHLSIISKFQYLRSCLVDNAARLIQSLDITPENYEQALKLLKSRYDNKGLIFQSHIEKLFSIKEFSKPNVSSLRNLIDLVNGNLRALNSIASKAQISDGIILYLLTSKLDAETQAKWEEEVSKKWVTEASSQELTRPTWNDLSTFLEIRCKTLEIVNKVQKLPVASHGRLMTNNQSSPFKTRYASSFAAKNQASSSSCVFCKNTPYHSAFHCKKFIDMNISERFRIIKRFNLCLNCLGSNHLATSCPSTNRCQYCKAAHHTLLHKDKAYQPSQADPTQPSIAAAAVAEQPCTLQASTSSNQVILGTARVELKAPNGRSIVVRALLDSGSQLHFVTERVAQYLRASRKKVNIEITGIACNTHKVYNNYSLVIKSSINGYSAPITAVVIPSITSYQPQSRLETSSFKIPANITLADQHFNVPGPIDLLIGAGLFYDLLMVGQIKTKNMPILQKTTLGWIVTGTAVSTRNTSHTSLLNSSQPSSLNLQTNKIKSSNSLFTFHCFLNTTKPIYNCLKCSTEPTLETILERFWRIEEPSREPIQTADEEECERFFEKTTSRCPHTNKFIVKLPFKRNPKELGSSVEIATKRYYSLEKRLSSMKDIEKEYKDFVEEYIALNHMEKASSNINSNYNYIPHHCVLKPDSSTTRLRVVFDGSCRTSNGLSLNSILRVGPTLQEDIFSILLRFRLHKFVLVADIAKMYRQVLVNENDTHWQSIMWRDKTSGNLSTYVLKTVTYGTSCAPYLAIKCLQVLAKEGELTYPIGSKVTLRDFYVDNLMTGGNSIEEVIDIKHQVTELLKGGGFPLRKFAANAEQILHGIPISEREEIIKVDDSEYIKTLGLKWLPKEDSFSYLYNLCPTPASKVTKRIILSHTAKLFDPLGLVNPIIVSCKLLLQRIWSLKLHWDESVPQCIMRGWSEIQTQLQMITTLNIPRYVIFNTHVNIHAFADASSKAYGACVYAVSYKNNERGASLLCSKSRVAPLKPISLPRLELCAALLLTQLLESVLKILPYQPQHIICWSDSTITLYWIAGDSTRWKPYVKNRVDKIKQTAAASNWRHVPSQLNPADILSRGALATNVKNNKLWFYGPEFLLKDESEWPRTQYTIPDETTCEMRKISLVALKTSTCNADILNNLKYINNYQKILRIFVYVSRFAFAVIRKQICKTGPIESEELKQSFEIICRLIQCQFFQRELQNLKTNQQIHRQSKLIMLSPFLHNGLIRVGGRLNNANLPFSEKHPIVLPSAHKFVHTIIRHYHHKNLHAGVQTLSNILRNSVWILKAKQTIKQIIHNCISCYRFRPITHHQVMGALPTDRVSQFHPFTVSGVDYCGPFYITQQLRGKSPIKVYIAIFICFSVKAVHIELVPNLTTNAFIAALKRFIARRGRCTSIFSDNATNFIGANRELKDMLKHFLTDQHNNLVHESCQQEGIEWKFIPPRSPHFGGLWESAVKQAKHYLRRAIGASILSFDELHTVCCQAEAIINSRPLTPLSNDPNDLQPLTPAHFLIGRSLQTILEPSTIDVNPASLRKYHILRWIQQEFWDRWRNEYLKTLQQRTKWYTVQENLKLNDLVLLKEESTPPLKWPLGRVIDLFPGADGRVRVVSVKTAEGTFKRAITRLCKLPIEI